MKYDKNAPSGTTVSGTTADSMHVYDTDKALTANGYSINNYKFLSWNTKKDGTGTSYTDGATVKNLTTENNGTVTLYAQWKQDVITVSVPSLTGTTSFTFDDTNHSVSVQNYNSTYMTQSGSTTAKNQGTYTVKWSLKDKTKYRWPDGSTGDKSATWKINWVNGKSHYSNDIYNRGWVAPGWESVASSWPNEANAYADHITFKTNNKSMQLFTTSQAIEPLRRFVVEASCSEYFDITATASIGTRNWDEYSYMKSNKVYNQLQTLYSEYPRRRTASSMHDTGCYFKASFSDYNNTIDIYRVSWMD